MVLDFGPEYVALLQLWVELEKSWNWHPPRKGFETLSQPVKLSEWSQSRKGSVSALCTAKLVNEFAQSVWKWWSTLQPAWRAFPRYGDRPAPIKQFGDSWSSLNKGGNNGWLGLITCIKWWREGLNSLPENVRLPLEADWFRAVEDLTQMLQGLLNWRYSVLAS